MVVLCANVYCQIHANERPYSGTNDGKAWTNADYRKEHVRQVPRYGLYDPNWADET